MFKKISAWWYGRVTPAVFLAALLIFLVFLALVLPRVAAQSREITGTKESADTSFVYTAADLYRIAEEYGEEGRAYYIRSRFSFDIIWPLAYLFFFVTSITLAYRWLSPGSPWRLLNILPFGGVLFDFLENTAASLVMYRYPATTPLVADLAPVFTLVKWGFIGASMLAVLAGLLLAAYRRIGDLST